MKVKQLIQYILILLILFSCKPEKPKQIKKESSQMESRGVKITKEERVLYNLRSFNLKEVEHYKLTIKESNKSIVHFYKNNINEKHNMVFKFDKKKNELIWGPQAFLKSKLGKKYTIEENSNKVFDYYWIDSKGSDQTSPVLFNKEYGVLGIYNIYGPDFICLKEKTSDLDFIKNILISMENYSPN